MKKKMILVLGTILAFLLTLPASGLALGDGGQIQAAAAAAKPSTPSAAAQAAAPPPGLDALVAGVMKTFEVPGVGLAIVKDGRIVAAKGYGVRRLGEPAPVDARTLFGIASNTKAFTATALGLLVEEKKLEWDAPVTRYMRWFQMSDPYVTREITVRDLLVHRSGLGLGAGDLLLWPPSEYSRREIVERLRWIPLAASFRGAYAYDNMLYVAAGELVEAVSGLRWEDFIVERIFARVGMRDSRPRHTAEVAGLNLAMPHAPLETGITAVAPSENDNMNAAGGILSNAMDLARWMLVQLGEGKLADGTRLFSERTARELAALVTPMPIAPPPAELAAQRMNFRGYALGFNVNDYRGRKLVSHTGGLTGYVSRLVLVPELALGVVVLTNQESGDAFQSIVYSILDHYFGAPKTDWAAAYLKVRERRRASTAKTLAEAEARREAGIKPSLALKEYARIYDDAWYGAIDVALEGGGLVMRFTKSPGLVGDLEHWSRETFVVRWRDRELRADAYVTFVLDESGEIVEARMKPFSPDVDFSYDFQDLLLKPRARESTK